IASVAKRAGTKTIVVFAPVSAIASATVSKTGMPSTSWPPLPGVTPATTCVPYRRLRSAWNEPSRPVAPCTTSRVSLSTTIAIRTATSSPAGRRAACGRSRRPWRLRATPGGAADDVRPHPGRRVDGHDLAPGLAQPPRDVPAPGRDVERLDALCRLAPFHDEVEVHA